MKPTFFERGGLWVVAQGVILSVVVLGALRWPGAERHPFLMLGGLALLAGGGVVGLAGAISLGRNLTPFPQPAARTRLVQTGIYGFMRHPLYTAVGSAALGWALLWGSWVAAGAAVVLGLFFNAKAGREERWLRRQFPEYAHYERRVRRFLPGIY